MCSYLHPTHFTDKGHMDRAKWGVGLRVGGGDGWGKGLGCGKWRQLYLNNNKKKT